MPSHLRRTVRLRRQPAVLLLSLTLRRAVALAALGERHAAHLEAAPPRRLRHQRSKPPRWRARGRICLGPIVRRHPPVFIAPAPRPPRSLANVRLSLTAATGKQDAEKITAYLTKTMGERIMLLDGAMGTTIQQYKFTEEDFRGAPRDVHVDLSRARWHARPAYTQWLAQPIPLTGRRQVQGRAGDPGAEGQQRSARLHAA